MKDVQYVPSRNHPITQRWPVCSPRGIKSYLGQQREALPELGVRSGVGGGGGGGSEEGGWGGGGGRERKRWEEMDRSVSLTYRSVLWCSRSFVGSIVYRRRSWQDETSCDLIMQTQVIIIQL